MGSVQILDGTIITPRIVGKSVGLAPLEVLLTMMGAGSLLGFFGVLLAVPLGAVVKILLQRIVKVYLASDFYTRSEAATATATATATAATIPDPTKVVVIPEKQTQSTKMRNVP
jgi:hypothetical protein